MQTARTDGLHSGMGIILRVVLLICHLALVHAETCSYEVSLPGNYSYQEVPLPSVNTSSSLVLEVKACRDAHLAISNSRDLSKDMFEFVFGANSNTFCDIRGCKLSCMFNYTFVKTLSCTEFRKVWIAWGPPGVRLGVGEKADNNTLVTTTAGASLTVHHVWISMFTGTTGDWRINCTYNETSTSTKPDVATSAATPTPTAPSVITTNIPIPSNQLTTSRTPDTTMSTMTKPRTSLEITMTNVNTAPPITTGNTPTSAEASTYDRESGMSESTSTSERATDVTTLETTATRMENSATTPASNPLLDVPRCCCDQVRPSSTLTTEKIVEELTLIEQTSARRRRLESASDNRASAQLMGLTAVAVLVTVTLIVVLPDLISLFVWTAVKLHLVKKHRKGL